MLLPPSRLISNVGEQLLIEVPCLLKQAENTPSQNPNNKKNIFFSFDSNNSIFILRATIPVLLGSGPNGAPQFTADAWLTDGGS